MSKSSLARGLGLVALFAGLASAQYPPRAPEVGAPDVRLSGAGVSGYVAGEHSAAAPVCAATADGALHVAWLDDRPDANGKLRWRVLYRRVDGWQDATQPSDIVLGPEVPLSAADRDAAGVTLASDGKSGFVVAWQEFANGVELIRARGASSNGATSFTAPSTLDAVLIGTDKPYTAPPVAAAIAAGNQRYAYVAWAQYDGTPGSGAGGLARGYDQIYFARSQDGGASWAVPAGVADTVNLFRDSHHEAPKLAADALGGVYVAFLDTRLSVPGITPALDAYVRISRDFGASFTTEKQLSRDGVLPPCPAESFAAIELSVAAPGDGSIVTAWIDASCAGFGKTQLHARRSSNQGLTWLADTLVGRSDGLMLHVDLALAAAPGGEAFAAWGRLDLDAPTSVPGRTSPKSPPVAGGPPKAPGLGPPGSSSPPANSSTSVSTTLVGAPPVTVFVSRFDTGRGQWTDEHAISFGGAGLGSKGVIPPLPRVQIVADPLVKGRVLATWMHIEPAWLEDFEVVAAWSDDAGNSWHLPSALGTEAGKDRYRTRAAFPQAALGGGRAVVVWDDRRHWTDPAQAGLPLPADVPLGAPSIYLNWIALDEGGAP